MMKKFVLIAREGLFFGSKSNLRPACLPLPRSPKSVSVDNYVKHTNIQRCGRSHVATAAAPSNKSNGQKARKRVSRDERRAMVESFVNEYRVINVGKFPRISDAMKQVGGSYYVVRKIIQELEYKSKMNSSNNAGENMVGKETFNEEKPLTTEAVKVSSGKTETVTDRPAQKNFQSVGIDKDIAYADYEHLEEKSGPHSNSRDRSMSKEDVISTTPGGYFAVADSKSLKRDAEELSQSSLQMSNDVKDKSNGPDSISPESHSVKGEIEHVSASYGEKSSISCSEAESHNLESLNMGSHLRKEEESVEKSGYKMLEQAALEESPEEPSPSSVQLTVDVKAEKAESSLSDSVAPESHLLKEGIEQPGSRETRDASPEEPSLSSVHLTVDVKAEKGESSLSDSVAPESHLLKKEIEQTGSREAGDAEVSRKSTLWENLKSFADGIMNIWRKL